MILQEEERFLPNKINFPDLPKDWKADEAAEKIQKLSAIAKPAVKDIITEFWVAHEMIVKGLAQGCTWERFCRMTGYDPCTPYRWFRRYGIQFTKATHRRVLSERPPQDGNQEFAIASSPARASANLSNLEQYSELEKNGVALLRALDKCEKVWRQVEENELPEISKLSEENLKMLRKIQDEENVKSLKVDFDLAAKGIRETKDFRGLVQLRGALLSGTQTYINCLTDIDWMICKILEDGKKNGQKGSNTQAQVRQEQGQKSKA